MNWTSAKNLFPLSVLPVALMFHVHILYKTRANASWMDGPPRCEVYKPLSPKHQRPNPFMYFRECYARNFNTIRTMLARVCLWCVYQHAYYKYGTLVYGFTILPVALLHARRTPNSFPVYALLLLACKCRPYVSVDMQIASSPLSSIALLNTFNSLYAKQYCNS